MKYRSYLKWLFIILVLLIILLFIKWVKTPPKGEMPHLITTIAFPYPFTGPTALGINLNTNQLYAVDDVFNQVAIFNHKGVQAILPIQQQSIHTKVVVRDPDWTYVINEYSASVSVLKGTKVITHLKVAGLNPRDMTINPNNSLVYVVTAFEDERDNEGKRILGGYLTIIEEDKIIDRVKLGDQIPGSKVVIDPLTNYIYIANLNDLVVFEGTQEIARFTVRRGIGDNIHAIDVNPNTGDVYVLTRRLTRFNAAKQVEIIDNLETNRSYLINMKVHPNTGDVYVLDKLQQQVLVIRNQTVVARLPIGVASMPMAIDPYTDNVYIVNQRGNNSSDALGTVTVINGTELLGHLVADRYPYDISINPHNGLVYIANNSSYNVSVFGFD